MESGFFLAFLIRKNFMNSKELLSLLDKHDVTYQTFTHPAVSTCEEADQYLKDRTFAKCKNLFIADCKIKLNT